jgi:tetratricopeptide (TPR) repeat protein
MALAGEGNNDGALKAFQRAAMQSEDRGVKSDAWNNVGNLLLGSEDVEGAIEAYKTSLRMDPNDAETRYNLNLAMAMRQQQEEQQQQESGEDQNQEDSEEQEKQDGESQENQDGEKEDQQNPDDGEQDPEGEEGEDQQQGEGDENEEGQENSDPSEDPQEGEESSPPGDPEASPEEPQEGKIQAADAERILDMLERNEAALRAKLQAQENAKRNKGKKTKIEKDW